MAFLEGPMTSDPNLQRKIAETQGTNRTAVDRLEREAARDGDFDANIIDIASSYVRASEGLARGINDLLWVKAAIEAGIPEYVLLRAWELKDAASAELNDMLRDRIDSH